VSPAIRPDLPSRPTRTPPEVSEELPPYAELAGESEPTKPRKKTVKRETHEEPIYTELVEETESPSDRRYVGKADFRMGKLPASHVHEAQKRFLRDGEALLAIVKGRVKAHSTKADGFFKTSQHETDKGGGFLYHFLVVTDRRVILWARGVFKSSIDSFDYSDITGVEHQRSGMFRGAIVLDVHGNKANFAEMHMEEAELVADMIREEKQRAKEDHRTRSSGPDSDPATQLEKLAALLEKGLITRSEFEVKKRKLLAKI
jgi:hypothetical protein